MGSIFLLWLGIALCLTGIGAPIGIVLILIVLGGGD